MNTKSLALAAAFGLTVPGLALAEFNYTSAEFDLVADVEFDSTSVDGDGFAIAGSYTIADGFFIAGSWTDADLDLGIDGELLTIGGGYFHTLDEDLDFVATLSLVDAEVSVGNFSADDDALSIGGGIRARLSDVIEVDAMLEYQDWDLSDNDTSVTIRGRYYFSEGMAAQVGIRAAGEIETLSIGIRGEF